MQPLMGNDLSEEVSLRLSLVQKESSYRRRSLVDLREKYLNLEKATECFPEFTEVGIKGLSLSEISSKCILSLLSPV